jgi:putative tryptophan/tyrosine transport system substrate-binding protein
VKRRDFITLVGGVAASWPLAAQAQQPTMARIGVLVGWPEGDPEAKTEMQALVEGLSQLGWTRDKNVRIDIRWAGIDPARMQQLAKELIELRPDVISHHSGGVQYGFGSTWFRLRRKLCSTGRQCNWICQP